MRHIMQAMMVAIGTLAITLLSCKKEDPVEPKPTLEAMDFVDKELNLIEGDQKELELIFAPKDIVNLEIIWESEDEKIAAVDQDGKVLAISEGNTTIVASCPKFNKKATCKVYVKAKYIHVEELTIEPKSFHLFIDESAKLKVIFKPTDATDPSVKWSTSEPKIAKVEQDGTVTGLAVGSATITAEVDKVKATCTVNVKPTLVEKVTLNETEITITEEETAQLKATVQPENATDKTIAWSSDHPEIAEVKDGTVTAKGAGTAIITAEAQGAKATCKVNVLAKHIEIKDLTLGTTSARLWEGETLSISADVKPDNASAWTLTWSSSADDVASVVDGNVTANSEGKATITATLVDTQTGQSITETCIVEVRKFQFTQSPVVELWGRTAEFKTNDPNVVWTLKRKSELQQYTEDNTSIDSDGKVLIKSTMLLLKVGGRIKYKPVYENVDYTVIAKQTSTGKTISTTITACWWKPYFSIIDPDYGFLTRIDDFENYEWYTGDEFEIRIETSRGYLEGAFDKEGFVVEIPSDAEGGGFELIDEQFPQCLRILESGSNYSLRVGLEKLKMSYAIKNVYL